MFIRLHHAVSFLCNVLASRVNLSRFSSFIMSQLTSSAHEAFPPQAPRPRLLVHATLRRWEYMCKGLKPQWPDKWLYDSHAVRKGVSVVCGIVRMCRKLVLAFLGGYRLPHRTNMSWCLIALGNICFTSHGNANCLTKDLSRAEGTEKKLGCNFASPVYLLCEIPPRRLSETKDQRVA